MHYQNAWRDLFLFFLRGPFFPRRISAWWEHWRRNSLLVFFFFFLQLSAQHYSPAGMGKPWDFRVSGIKRLEWVRFYIRGGYGAKGFFLFLVTNTRLNISCFFFLALSGVLLYTSGIDGYVGQELCTFIFSIFSGGFGSGV